MCDEKESVDDVSHFSEQVLLLHPGTSKPLLLQTHLIENLSPTRELRV